MPVVTHSIMKVMKMMNEVIQLTLFDEKPVIKSEELKESKSPIEPPDSDLELRFNITPIPGIEKFIFRLSETEKQMIINSLNHK